MLLCPVEDLGFPRRQRDANLGEGGDQPIIWQTLCQKLHKKERNGLMRETFRDSTPLDSPKVFTIRFLLWFNKYVGSGQLETKRSRRHSRMVIEQINHPRHWKFVTVIWFALVLKPKADVTGSPKLWYGWHHERNQCNPSKKVSNNSKKRIKIWRMQNIFYLFAETKSITCQKRGVNPRQSKFGRYNISKVQICSEELKWLKVCTLEQTVLVWEEERLLKETEVDEIGEVCNSFNHPLTTHFLQ